MISVCMATYNGEKYIKEQLDSILKQLCDTDEVIISDDSSADRTVDIIKSYNDPRIKVYTGNHYKSPIFNLENALSKAQGEYVFLSDQDDVWMDNKISVMMKYLLKYECVVSDAIVVDGDLNEIAPSYFKTRKCRSGIVRNIIKNGYIGCCMAFNSSLLDKVLPFPKEIPMHDVWIGLNAERYGKSIFIEERLIKYRRHGNNASSTSEKSNNSFIQKIKYRVNLVKVLLNAEKY